MRAVHLLRDADRLQKEGRLREAFDTISEALAVAREAEVTEVVSAPTATVILSGTLLLDKLAVKLGETGATHQDLQNALVRAKRAASVDPKLGETLKDHITWFEHRLGAQGVDPNSGGA